MEKIIWIAVLGFTISSCGTSTSEDADNQKKISESVIEVAKEKAPVVEEVIVEEKVTDSIVKDEIVTIEKFSNEESINEPEPINKRVEAKESTSEIVVEEVEEVVEEIAPMVIKFNHLKFNELLQKHVSNEGVVNYDSFKKEQYKLSEYLKMLASSEPKDSWSKNKKLAYYINLYNASTISLILDKYPLKSIMDIDKAWDISFVKIGSKTLSLNDIENKIIRPIFKEPRIHFAVNCAAVSCPKISNQAFSESNLESLLQENTERFVANNSIGVIQKGDEVNVSQIFEWYAVDFGGKSNILKWISDNSKMNLSSATLGDFIPYNWDLNNK